MENRRVFFLMGALAIIVAGGLAFPTELSAEEKVIRRPKPPVEKQKPPPEQEKTCSTVCTTRQECTMETYVDGEICMPSEPTPTCLPRYRTRRVCHPVQDCKEVCR
jgi:hypothetical protein